MRSLTVTGPARPFTCEAFCGNIGPRTAVRPVVQSAPARPVLRGPRREHTKSPCLGATLMIRRLVSLLFGVSLLLGVGHASAENTLRVATLAPKNSAWGKVFNVWSKALDKKTAGK